MKVQDFIKYRRTQLGITLKEIADYVGVAEATVSRWESGDIANMRRDRIYKLSQVLKISPMLLMESDVSEDDVKSVRTPKESAIEWIEQSATKEEKIEVLTAIVKSSGKEEGKELLNNYIELLMK